MFYSCKSTSKAVQSKPKYNLDLLYRVWDVDSIIVGGKSASGYEMGDPQYEFTREGKRIKSFKVPPHSESVSFYIRNDSIHYSAEKALPSSAIVELTEKRLVLENEKAVWKLYVK
jgi:hypothetical protein